MGKQSKLLLVKSIFEPDENGLSDWKTREELSTTELKLSNNGNSRYGIMYGVSQYEWKIKRKNDTATGRIEKIRTTGLNDNDSSSRPISRAIRAHFKGHNCVVCATSEIIIDHKNDLYNDPRVLNKDTQVPDDFQPLCNACNLRKRAVCTKTKEEGKRFGATNIPQFAIFGIDFIQGDETYDENDPNAMVGTYWYDPVKFMEYIKLNT